MPPSTTSDPIGADTAAPELDLADKLEHLTLLAEEKPHQALTALEALLTEHPGWVPAIYARAHVLMDMGQAAEALNTLESVPQTQVSEWLVYGRAARGNQRANEATAALRRVLMLDPDSIDALRFIGTLLAPAAPNPESDARLQLTAADALLRDGHFAAAGDACRRAYQIDPDEGLAFLSRASILRYLASSRTTHPALAHRQELCDALQSRLAGHDGVPADIIPTWETLGEHEQGILAYSLLCYGELLGAMLDAELKIYILPLQTSITERLERAETHFGSPYTLRATLRSWEALYVGRELLVRALSEGSTNTVVHELTHWAQRYLEGDSRNTAFFQHVKRRYEAALAGPDNAPFNAYSTVNVREYFAEAMAAMVGFGTRQRLDIRNPDFIPLGEQMILAFARLPEF